MYHNFFIRSSLNGCLACFHVLTVVNSVAVNIGIHVSFSTLVSSGYMPRSGIAGSYGGLIPSFLSNLHTIKLLEENIGRTLDDINQSRILYDSPPRVMEIKTKVNKWDLIKLKSFCTVKGTISKVKRQPRMGENNSKWKQLIKD